MSKGPAVIGMATDSFSEPPSYWADIDLPPGARVWLPLVDHRMGTRWAAGKLLAWPWVARLVLCSHMHFLLV